MEFRNLTPFPAQAFEGIDQYDQAFHVIVLRQTLSFASGRLYYVDEQQPLCEADEFFGEMNHSSVRQESDYCQYKPRCDVIVNATAYAPQGLPARQFSVSLTVRRPDQPAVLPEQPQGLSPVQGPTLQQMNVWREAARHARNHPVPGQTLIQKTLIVHGERAFTRNWLISSVFTLLKWSSLGLIQLNPWRMTRSRVITQLPIRAEYAYGGEARINTDEAAARRVSKKYRLPGQAPSQNDDIPPPGAIAIAHAAWEANSVGRGFTTRWYINASRCRHIPAPQITNPGAPVTARWFWKIARGKYTADSALVPALQVSSMGVRSKGHPRRRCLTGTIDDDFIQSDAWLPEDFDFAVWNAAPEDQQTAYLQGDEVIELTNLCTPETPCAGQTQKGDTRLRLLLPGHLCFTLLRMNDGSFCQQDMHIDTLIIEPDNQTVTLIWRGILPKSDDIGIRVCEARMQEAQTSYNDIKAAV